MIVNNAPEFAAAARSCCPNIHIVHIPSNEVDNVRREFEVLWTSENLKPIQQVHKNHFFRKRMAPGSFDGYIVGIFTGVEAPKTSTILSASLNDFSLFLFS